MQLGHMLSLGKEFIQVYIPPGPTHSSLGTKNAQLM